MKRRALPIVKPTALSRRKDDYEDIETHENCEDESDDDDSDNNSRGIGSDEDDQGDDVEGDDNLMSHDDQNQYQDEIDFEHASSSKTRKTMSTEKHYPTIVATTPNNKLTYDEVFDEVYDDFRRKKVKTPEEESRRRKQLVRCLSLARLSDVVLAPPDQSIWLKGCHNQKRTRIVSIAEIEINAIPIRALQAFARAHSLQHRNINKPDLCHAIENLMAEYGEDGVSESDTHAMEHSRNGLTYDRNLSIEAKQQARRLLDELLADKLSYVRRREELIVSSLPTDDSVTRIGLLQKLNNEQREALLRHQNKILMVKDRIRPFMEKIEEEKLLAGRNPHTCFHVESAKTLQDLYLAMETYTMCLHQIADQL